MGAVGQVNIRRCGDMINLRTVNVNIRGADGFPEIGMVSNATRRCTINYADLVSEALQLKNRLTL